MTEFDLKSRPVNINQNNHSREFVNKEFVGKSTFSSVGVGDVDP